MRTWYPVVASVLLLVAVAVVILMTFRVRALTNTVQEVTRTVDAYCGEFVDDLKRSLEHYKQSLAAIEKAPTAEERQRAEARFDQLPHPPLGGGSIASRMGSSMHLTKRFNFCVATRQLPANTSTQMRDGFTLQKTVFVESEDRAAVVSALSEMASLAATVMASPSQPSNN